MGWSNPFQSFLRPLMLISSHPFGLIVHCEVQEHHLEAFLQEVCNNAENSRKEPGCLRFDVLQDAVDAKKFMLYEIYVNEAALEVGD